MEVVNMMLTSPLTHMNNLELSLLESETLSS